MSAIPEQYIDLLESGALAHVATIGPKGEPQHTTTQNKEHVSPPLEKGLRCRGKEGMRSVCILLSKRWNYTFRRTTFGLV